MVQYVWFHDWCSRFLYQEPRGLTRVLVVLVVYACWSVLTKRLQVGLVGLPWLGYWRQDSGALLGEWSCLMTHLASAVPALLARSEIVVAFR